MAPLTPAIERIVRAVEQGHSSPSEVGNALSMDARNAGKLLHRACQEGWLKPFIWNGKVCSYFRLDKYDLKTQQHQPFRQLPPIKAKQTELPL